MMRLRVLALLFCLILATVCRGDNLLLLLNSGGPDLTAGLILHLKFDNTITDSSGNGFNCTFTGAGPTYAAALITGGNSLDANGTDDLCTITQNATINDLVTMTIAVHINFDTFGEGTFGRIADKGGTAWDFYVQDSNDRLAFNFYRWATTDGNWLSPIASIATATTYCIVVTYDAGSTANEPIFYIDNSVVVTTETSNPAGTLNAETVDLAVANRAAQDRTFDGRLDDFRVYNIVWTQGQVNAYCAL